VTVGPRHARCITGPVALPAGFTHPHASEEARQIAERGMILPVQVGSGVHGTSISGQDDRDEMGLCLGVELLTTGRITLPVPEPDRDRVDSWLHRSYAVFWNAGTWTPGPKACPECSSSSTSQAIHHRRRGRCAPRPQRTCMLRELPVRRSSRTKCPGAEWEGRGADHWGQARSTAPSRGCYSAVKCWDLANPQN
jgi:hypothetical protein